MIPAVTLLPFKAMASFRTFTVDEYDRLIETGFLTKHDRVELLEGYVVLKIPGDPPHEFATTALYRRLDRLVPPGWVTRCQQGVSLADSKPEPDVAVARGDERDYVARQPGPTDLGLVAEVSDSSLDRDLQDKTRIYARDWVPEYWIVNLVDRRVEVYTDPTGPADDPRYHTLRVFAPGSAVPVELDGVTVGMISVDELMP
ncbi:MAG: Uma2 family endonuclease [Gemmataceae bacterium]|nr:Uma2 family endonuclease [Gemmataceae bacterium]